MDSEIQANKPRKNPFSILVIVFVCIVSILLIFKNTLFESTLALKSLGNISMDPEIAFNNKKPTFLEFYAEWCEVCKEMAPGVIKLKNDYQEDINFVFLNVDNPKWEKYIKQFNVNGIPQMVLFDDESQVKNTLVGLNNESFIDNALNGLLNNKQDIVTTESKTFSLLENKSKEIINPRSHS